MQEGVWPSADRRPAREGEGGWPREDGVGIVPSADRRRFRVLSGKLEEGLARQHSRTLVMISLVAWGGVISVAAWAGVVRANSQRKRARERLDGELQRRRMRTVHALIIARRARALEKGIPSRRGARASVCAGSFRRWQHRAACRTSLRRAITHLHARARYRTRRGAFLAWRDAADSSNKLSLALSRLGVRAARRNLLLPFAALGAEAVRRRRLRAMEEQAAGALERRVRWCVFRGWDAFASERAAHNQAKEAHRVRGVRGEAVLAGRRVQARATAKMFEDSPSYA
ncbi:hypothetical protein T484DRAFT_1821179 [Baffinella frigidus]|nr:hypothetical protein T484DRAFT_1821179 [Cryptophyta sp. CCMP2293]